MEAPALTQIRNELAAAVGRGHVHGAYLIDGGPGTPREVLAEWLARRLLCAGTGTEPCGACPSCRRVGRDDTGRATHPDLRWVEPEGTQIKVEQVRALQRDLALRSNEGGRRVAVLLGAETLRAASANALLKTLEEPPPGCVLVLVAEGAAGLPATVRSRTVRLRLPPESEPEIRAALEADGLEPRDAWLAACVGGGSREAARAWADDALEGARELLGFVAGIDRVGATEILDFAESFRGGEPARRRAELLLAVHAAWSRESAERALAEGRSPERWLDQFDANQRARGEMRMRNLNPQLVVEGLLLDLRASA